MTGKTHKIFGMTASIGYYLSVTKPEYGPATLGMLVAASYVGSLLPDIDQPAAEIWEKLPFGRNLSTLADPFFKHRNMTHSIIGFGVIGFLVSLLINSMPDYWGIDKNIIIVAFGVGYLSHILADMFTVEGVPIFWPYKRMFGIPPKPLEGIRIITGKWFENLVIFPLIDLAFVIIIWTNWDNLKKILFK